MQQHSPWRGRQGQDFGFGLNFVCNAQDSEEISAEEVGAIPWKAPEVIARQTRGPFASERVFLWYVYSGGREEGQVSLGCYHQAPSSGPKEAAREAERHE